MTTTIEKDIAEAIQKNLPAAIGEELRTQLGLIPKLQEQLQAMTNDPDTHQNYRRELSDLLNAANEKLKAHGDLATREAALLKREQAQALNDLRVELANERRVEIVGLVSTIFRSPIMQRTLSGTVPVPYEATPPNQYSSCGSPAGVMPSSVNLVETHEQR